MTGSNGKTTTTELVGHVHRTAGCRWPWRATSAPAELPRGAPPPDRVTSSARLVVPARGHGAFAPDAAALINLVDGPSRPPRDFAAYRAAKLEAVAREPPRTAAVLPEARPADDVGGRGRRGLFGTGPGADAADRDGRLRGAARRSSRTPRCGCAGAHNRENAMVATALTLARGLDPAAVRTALRDFAASRTASRRSPRGRRRPLRRRLEGDERRLRGRRISARFPAACTPCSAAAARARTMRRWPRRRPSAAAPRT